MLVLMPALTIGSVRPVRASVAPAETLVVRTQDTGSPVVLVPGPFGSAHGYREVAARLESAGWRVIAAAVAIAAVSPIPDWITRTLAAVARYPAGRYVLADTLGRLPKLWIPAALGTVVAIPDRWLIAASVASIVIGGGAGIWRWLSVRRTSAPRS